MVERTRTRTLHLLPWISKSHTKVLSITRQGRSLIDLSIILSSVVIMAHPPIEFNRGINTLVTHYTLGSRVVNIGNYVDHGTTTPSSGITFVPSRSGHRTTRVTRPRDKRYLHIDTSLLLIPK